MKIAVDMDNTIFTQGSPDAGYKNSHPIFENIKIINELSKDNEIYIYTARHFNHFQLTKRQLEEAGVIHHGLILGKFNYDILIDDKALNADLLEDKELLFKKINDSK